ncbi:sorbosone dehydrogenase family protein [Pseudomonas sp. CK-NBRI-02]|nr:sorbosone dehydrogenase family protein [Pseudomonas sp. CK-NBRI-02]TYO83487.1 sorbosone dehydrogenase family protein [Pseudomonas sp. CK-NBRI-02]
MDRMRIAMVLTLSASLSACGESARLEVSDGFGPSPRLPEPNKTLIPTVNIAPATGWPDGATPTAAAGTRVVAFARDLDHPRWLYVLPNGDVLVAETNAPPKPEDGKGLRGWVMGKVMERAGAGVPSANRITLLRDADHDGVAEVRSTFIEGLNSPFGMTLVGKDLYVADTDRLLRFHYEEGAMQIRAEGRPVTDLPGGPLNHHWTKNVIASPDGKKLYVTVGSNSNVGENGLEKEQGRAAIWEVDPASGEHRIFASGLRNPNGLAWEPRTGALWTAVNERDEIGSDLVPDYITSVKDGGFYGWPFSYYGQHVDQRVEPQDPGKVAQAIVPDYAVGAHTASLGLAFAQAGALPPPFEQGAFVGQHGSWNRKPHSGYKVIFVPFDSEGKPAGKPIDLLTGFLDGKGKAMGRPVGVVNDRGGLLVADDVGNVVWRVSRK